MNPAVAAPSTCPHLGTSDDPSAYYSYPSADNRCYHATRPATPLLAHQEAFCLGGSEKECPVYLQPRKQAFPRQLEEVQAVSRRGSATLRTAIAIVVGVTVIGYAAFRLVPRLFSSPTGPAASPPAVATVAPSVKPLPTPTASPAPTATLVPTGTSSPPLHQLDVPFEVDGHQLLMHKVGAGDMFDTIDAAYETTPAVLRALNYSLRDSLLANSVLVIAPGLQTADPALPSFKVRQVDAITATVDDLALQYHVEADMLRHYNGCSDTCTFAAGDWILLPVIADSTPTP